MSKLDEFPRDDADEIEIEKTSKNRVPFKEIVSLYHEILDDLPATAKLSKAREAQIRARWNNDLPDLEEWGKYFEYVKQSDFLMGKAAPPPGRNKPFVANLEWLTKEANMIKIIEGNYHG